MTDSLYDYLEETAERSWEWFWGATPEVTLARANSKVRQAMHKLERKRKEALAAETSLLAELRRAAPRARSVADMRSAAQAVARNRRGITRIDKMHFQLTGLQQQLLETETQNLTTTVMHDVVGSLMMANSVLGGAREVQHTMLNFQRQKAVLEYNHEQVSSLDDEEEEEEDAETLVAQLVQEQHLQLSFDLPAVAQQQREAPRPPPPAAQPAEAEAVCEADDGDIDSLMRRFENLKRRS